MNNIQEELNLLFDDSPNSDDSADVVDVDKLTTNTKKGRKTKAKQPKAEALVKTPFIKVRTNNESRWFKAIEGLAKQLDGRRIVDVYGNSGLICYWLKRLCPTAEVVMNDSYNMTAKYPADVLEKYFKGIEIAHNDCQSYLNEQPSTIYLLNPKSFDLLPLHFLILQPSLIIFGNDSDPSQDIINVYNDIICPLLPDAETISHESLQYADEHNYMWCDIGSVGDVIAAEPAEAMKQ